MCTYSERSHIGCDVSYPLGPVSLVVLFGQHSEGEESFLIYILVYLSGNKKVHEPHWSSFTSLNACRSGQLHQVETLKWLTLIMKNMYDIYIHITTNVV